MLFSWQRMLSNQRRKPFRRPRVKPVVGVEVLEERVVPSGGPTFRPTYVLLPQTGSEAASPATIPINTTAYGFNPLELRTAYGVNSTLFNGSQATGSGQTIAIVDANDDPNIFGDLDTFDQGFTTTSNSGPTLYSQYGAASTFLTVYNQSGTVINPANPGTNGAPGTGPTGNGAWQPEESLDVEWAHSIAPGAKIALVEANSSGSGLFTADSTAAGITDVSVVSNSWGGTEFNGETSYDHYFQHSGVTFLASTGDDSYGSYPAFSPDVVAVGGTTLHLNANFTISSETAWSTGSDSGYGSQYAGLGTGGGTSQYEHPAPTYQSGFQNTGYRTIPDVAMDADLATGVEIYDTYGGSADDGNGLEGVGGTSVSSPCFAGIIAMANQGRALNGLSTFNSSSNPTQALTALYHMPSTDFNDITSGSITNPNTHVTYNAGVGYDEVTGRGSPVTNSLVGSLVVYGLTPTVTASSANLAANATSMTIAGTNFDTYTANDSVSFSNSVTGTITAATGTSLTVSLTGLSSLVADTALKATVTSDSVTSGTMVEVALVAPVVTSSTANLPTNSTSLTIAGFGFDTTASHDTVSFSNGVTGSVTTAHSTSLTVSLTGLGGVAGGTALTAIITVDTVSSGSAVQVATVTVPNPTVTSSSTNLADSSTTITINGSNFSTTPASDSVTFNLGVAGSVTSATASQLIVALSAPPTALGSLTAVVTVSGNNSGSAVQVATEVNGTWTVTDAAGTAGTGSLTDVRLPYAVVNSLGGDTVNFAGSLSTSTITLSSVLSVGHNLTITGLGAANLAVSGNNAVEVITVSSGVTSSISSLTVENGKTNQGGGIYDHGTLTLNNVALSGNSASGTGGGIFNAGSLMVSGCTLSGNSATTGGGGIFSSGTLTLNTSILSGNSADHGGGIYNYGTLTVSNSTLSGNDAYSGGGMINYLGSAMVSNSTLSGNSAKTGGGISNLAGTLTVSNSTVSGNSAVFTGGGIGNYNYSGGGIASLMLLNTIVAGNIASTGPDEYNDGTVTASYSLIGNNAASGVTTSGNNIVNPMFVGLSSLGNYGGPTQTIALLPGSPAIDAGSNSLASGLSTDQRGDTRIVNGTVDIGAFESQGFTFSIVSGNNQTTQVSTAFNPLVVSVTAKNAGEPVNGGQVTFTATPAASGASASLATSPATISGAQASVTPTANAAAGSYTVAASASGASSVSFILSNSPTVTTSTANLPGTATSLTIAGLGFDTTAAHDSVTFDNGVTGTVTSATGTSLTVSLTGLTGVSDGAALHASVTTDGVSGGSAVEVAIVYAPPTANGQSLSTNENTATSGTLTASESGSNPLTYAVVSNPAHGSLTSFNASTGAFTFTPTTGYYGADSFTFTASDGVNTSTAATVSLSVVDNVTPVANGQSLSTNENTAVSGTLTGSDADNNPLTTYAVVSNPADGSLTSFNASTGTFTYTPTTGYSGPDSFTFTVSDGTNTSTAATVSITVVGTQTAPAVSGLTPASGLAGGGTSVVITGTNFTGATAVDFGSTAATSFTVNSATQITATDAAGGGVVDVTVATGAGTSATSSADQFTYAAVSGVKVNGDVAPIVDISSNGSGTVTATTDGNNGFTAGDTVVISGYTAANTTGYNGTFTIGAASGDTFTVSNAMAGLTTLTNNNLGLAVSQNTASSLIGNQRSMVDSVAYTFSEPVSGLTASNFTLSAAASAVGSTTSGSATAATTAPGMTLTSLDGGSIWVVTWSNLLSSAGHSIADGVYELTLGNSGRPTDTFYRLFANVVGYQSSSAHINSTDSLDFSHSYLLGTGAATYLADCDYNADGLVNSTDSLQLSHRYLSVWTGFTPTL